MNHEITHGPSFAVLRVALRPGEIITAESGAMVSRSANVKMKTRLNAPRNAGFFGMLTAFLVAMIRKVIGGESFMINDFSADTGGEVLLAPTFSGEVAHKALNGDRLLLTRGAFLAASGNIELKMRWGGLRGLLAREGVFFLEVSGTGDLFYTSYGGVVEVPVNGKLVVDNGHLVAFDPALDFTIRSAGGGLMGFLASGEGLVCEFNGRGSVIIQSRNVSPWCPGSRRAFRVNAMQIDIQYRPTHAMAHVRLGPGESMLAESGAMVGMSPNVQVQTGGGGLMKGLKRLFGGESFFRNTFTAEGGSADLYLAPALSGDMVALQASPSRGYFLQSTAFVACSPGVDVETKVGGFKTFFAGEGIFVLKTQGTGTVIAGAYGAIEQIDVRGEYIVDSGHLVAWDESLQYSVTKAADGWIASFLSGEGLVCQFRGQGTVWIQTRNPAAYGQTLGKLLPPRRE